MKILNVAYPFAPVRHDTAGGAEQVVAMLDRALVRAGHQSLVIACEGSGVCGRLLPGPDTTGILDRAMQEQVRRTYRELIGNSVERCHPDLVHLHGIDFLEYLPAAGVPVLATLHLPPSWYVPAVFSIDRPRTWLNCVSQSQQNSCLNSANLLPFISNGVPEELARSDVSRRNFALSLGRICPEKGFHIAIDAAEAAGIPFLLAGQVFGYVEHERYFEEQIVPRFGLRTRFLGPVGICRKRRLLSAARCVLIPSLAPETSSLVAMEAAMCGTPVVAFRCGALPEVVEHGVTGYVVDNTAQMADAIGECDRIDPAVCRATAFDRFSERSTAANYIKLYERLIRQ